jgi:hypothetical protein
LLGFMITFALCQGWVGLCLATTSIRPIVFQECPTLALYPTHKA